MAGRAPDPATRLRAAAEAEAAGLPGLMLAAERLAATVEPGAHGRRRGGMGEAFWQFRPAQPGDAAGQIDWRRSARSDAAFVREREEQTPASAAIWVAADASMDWTGDSSRPTKHSRALVIALALGLALLRGGERVGRIGAPPRTGRPQGDRLGRDLLAATGDLPALSDLRPAQRIVLIGDFLGPMPPLAALLSRAAALGGTGGALLQVLDPVEESFPFTGALHLRAPGGGAHRTHNAAGLRDAYLGRLAARRAELAQRAAEAGMQFGTHDTAAPPSGALLWLAGALWGRGA